MPGIYDTSGNLLIGYQPTLKIGDPSVSDGRVTIQSIDVSIIYINGDLLTQNLDSSISALDSSISALDTLTQNLDSSIGLYAPQLGTIADSSTIGTSGQIQYDASYLYVCTSANIWMRILGEAF